MLSSDKLLSISKGFTSFVSVLIRGGAWNFFFLRKEGLRENVFQGGEPWKWSMVCKKGRKKNLLITFKISQNLVLVPERFLGGLE